MALRAALVVQLENIRLRPGRRGGPVSVIAVQPVAAYPSGPESVLITVESVQAGVPRRASARVLATDLANDARVIEAVTRALREAPVIAA